MATQEEKESRIITQEWRHDVDRKLSDIARYINDSDIRDKALRESVDELVAVLQAGRGGLGLLFLIAKVMGAITVIAGAIGAWWLAMKGWKG